MRSKIVSHSCLTLAIIGCTHQQNWKLARLGGAINVSRQRNTVTHARAHAILNYDSLLLRGRGGLSPRAC